MELLDQNLEILLGFNPFAEEEMAALCKHGGQFNNECLKLYMTWLWRRLIFLCTDAVRTDFARNNLDLTADSEIPRDRAISLIEKSLDCCSSTTLLHSGGSRNIARLSNSFFCCRT